LGEALELADREPVPQLTRRVAGFHRLLIREQAELSASESTRRCSGVMAIV
jgi:hypothetical protein